MNHIGLKQKKLFASQGFCLIPEYIESNVCRDMIDAIENSEKLRFVEQENTYTPHGKSIHYAIDSYGLDFCWPGIGRLYDNSLSIVASLIQKELISSPYERSKYYVKKYPAPEGNQGWHKDTNCLSVVLYLSDNYSGETEIICSDGITRLVHPQAGKMLVLDGSRLMHRARAVAFGSKYTLIMNMYHPDHPDRPVDLDEKIFGSVQ